MDAQLETEACDLTNDPPGQDLLIGEEAIAGEEAEEGDVLGLTRVRHQLAIDNGFHAVVETGSLVGLAVLLDDEGATHDHL